MSLDILVPFCCIFRYRFHQLLSPTLVFTFSYHWCQITLRQKVRMRFRRRLSISPTSKRFWFQYRWFRFHSFATKASEDWKSGIKY